MPILLIQREDYADEFEIQGCIILDDFEWEVLRQEWEEGKYPTEAYFGTNEFIEFESFKDLMRHITIQYITHDEKDLLIKLLSPRFRDFGVTAFPDFSED